MNKTDYTASLAINCIGLIEQTNQEGVPSSTYLHLSLTTFYLLHQMAPLNLFGAVSPPTMGLSPLAASIGHPTVRTIQLFKRLNIASVQQNTTLTTPSLLATWTLKTTHGCQQTTRILPGKNCGTHLYYGLQQLINFPTYLFRGTPYSCIDIVATDCSTISVTSAAPLGGSDHLSINVHINSPPHPHPIGSVKGATRWRWLPHNVLSLRQSLADADMIGDPPLDTPDSNKVTELWTKLEEHSPTTHNNALLHASHQTPFQQEPWPIPALDNKGAAKLDQGET